MNKQKDTELNIFTSINFIPDLQNIVMMMGAVDRPLTDQKERAIAVSLTAFDRQSLLLPNVCT